MKFPSIQLPRTPMQRAVTVAAGLTLFGVVLGTMGPFGSYQSAGLPVRVAYWVGVLWLGVLFYGLPLAIAVRQAAIRRSRFWLWMALATVGGSVPQAVFSRAIALWLWPHLDADALPLFGWYLQVLLVAALTTTGIVAALRLPPVAAVAQRGNAGLLEQLPPHLGRDVLCLQMEDHYVRVHTPRGSALVLMPLAQAIRPLSAVPGLRVHRSWWVARHAVVGVAGPARAMTLTLTNGLTVPVARNSVAAMRAAGWL
jgi:LytTr DNA-binding domain